MRIFIAAGLLALLLGLTPARADQVCSGTVRWFDSQTLWINTSQGVFAVPVTTAVFTVHGNRVFLNQLRPGVPVTVFAPVITPVSSQRFFLRDRDDDDDDRGHRRGRGKGKGKGRR